LWCRHKRCGASAEEVGRHSRRIRPPQLRREGMEPSAGVTPSGHLTLLRTGAHLSDNQATKIASLQQLSYFLKDGLRLLAISKVVHMAAFAEMLSENIPNLRRYARVLVRDAVHAEDLVQDCLERAISREHLWREGTNLRAWLFTILHNLYINQYLRHGSVGTMVPLLDEHNHLSCPARQFHSVTLRDLARAFEQLPEQERQVVMMVGVDGMQYEDAAEALGVPMGTVKSRLSRARRRLRRLMDGDAVDDEPTFHDVPPPPEGRTTRRRSEIQERDER